MIVHTSAIVFKSVDYQETSKIVTLFTEEHGKLAVIVRGAKKQKSKFSGLIEVGNILDVVYYHKESRSVQILTEASLLEKTLNLRLNFEKMAAAMSAVELISQLLHEGEVNRPLFDFTKNFLLWLNDTEFNSKQIFPYVQIKLAGMMGIGISLEAGSVEKDTNYFFNIETGNIAPRNSGIHSCKLSASQFKYISMTLQDRGSKIFDINFINGGLKELIQHLDRYFKYHLDGFKDRMSDSIFEQILQD